MRVKNLFDSIIKYSLYPMKIQRVFFFDLLVDFGVFGAAQDVVDADIIKVGKDDQCFGRRYSLTVFVFRNKSLLNACMHLQCDLC